MDLIVVANDVNHVRELAKLNINNIVVSSCFSTYRNSFNIEEIKECLKISSNIFVSFYDLISETIIDDAISLIDQLINIGVKNFIINDLGLVQYLKKFNVNVVYDNITLNTNYETLNILSELGISSAVLGREITLEEINEISERTNINTIVHIQGMFPIFSSIRKLVENYEKAKNMTVSKEELSLLQRDRDAKYPIIENNNGVIMFSSYEQCSIEDIKNISTKTLLIDQPFISNSDSIEIVKMYLDYENYNMSDIKNISKYKQSKGFFYKKTMYRL